MQCILVSENAILREKLEEVLLASGFTVGQGAERPDGLADPGADTIVVLDLAGDPGMACREAARWRAGGRRVRIVALAMRSQQARIMRTCGALLDGLVLSSHPVPVIVGVLRAVAADYRVMPAEGGADCGEVPAAPLLPLPSAGLSERQAAILDEMCRGATNKEIAKALAITETTVKVHLRGIYRALGVTNRTQAALWAMARRGGPEELAEAS